MGHCWKTDKIQLGKEPTLPTFMFPWQWPCHVEQTSSRDRLGTLGAVGLHFLLPPSKERYSRFWRD